MQIYLKRISLKYKIWVKVYTKALNSILKIGVTLNKTENLRLYLQLLMKWIYFVFLLILSNILVCWFCNLPTTVSSFCSMILVHHIKLWIPIISIQSRSREPSFKKNSSNPQKSGEIELGRIQKELVGSDFIPDLFQFYPSPFCCITIISSFSSYLHEPSSVTNILYDFKFTTKF